MRMIICGAVSGPNTVAPITVDPVWYDVSMAPSRMAMSVSSTFFQGVLSILGDLPSLLSDYLLCIGAGVCWDL